MTAPILSAADVAAITSRAGVLVSGALAASHEALRAEVERLKVALALQAESVEHAVRQQDRLAAFAATWGDRYLADDLGPRLTCGETRPLVALLAALGDGDGALSWWDAHSQSEEGCECPSPAPAVTA